MGIRTNLHDLKRSFFAEVAQMYQNIAARYDFPENKGMPFEPPEKYWWSTEPTFKDLLPVNHLRFPPETFPTNYLEVFIGGLPRPTELTRYYYESKVDGYYNFYVLNYKNNIYLPNWFSEFLQIQCHFCLDITFLEQFREVFFVILAIYNYIITFRLLLGWLMSINPYTLPFSYIVACVDWVEELSIGILPVIGGVGFATPCLFYLVGRTADFLRAYMEKFYGHLNIDILPDMNNLIHHVN